MGRIKARPGLGLVPDELIELKTTSDTANVAAIRSAVRRAAVEAGFGDDDVSGLALAVDEAVANVIRHGYGGRGGQPIEVTIGACRAQQRRGIVVTISDRGCQVEPDSICGRDLDDIRPGGLGTHIMKAVMDEIVYEQREGGGMRVRMVKWLPGGESQEVAS
jgi:anti-sigma regulatory factor (Ser/Thr protein kinase)